MKDGKFITLGIESSCDETAVSITADGRQVLSNIISSQIDVHKVFGGVVPEIAARHHLEQINGVLDEAMREANITFAEVDLIGATEGPGLIGAVLVGLSTAKALALALGKPLTGVHHIKGHISAAYLENADLTPPFLALILSGGHTDLIDVRSYQNLRVIGRTRDDAIGEAFDKVARVLGLGYPGGPKIDALAPSGTSGKVSFKRVMLEKDSLDFSFSGIKTGVLNYVNTEKQAGRLFNTADVAAEFEASVTDVIVAKTLSALSLTGYDKLVVGGGVASNSLIRQQFAQECALRGIALYIPSPVFCTDNAAMIACAAYYDHLAGKTDSLDLDAKATLEL
ncbi:MAG: tRNA (adenosine(37)-N6)-threonylcarbamoyltransferase complex transferase subunit TsaD [Clostridiales Family XIII bacterium]|jgi:N6-L-threonylcarbamoyladenine synthase|nr:tRNA (adenosine(37)-N6)-threonylcarbamoyltransferase complex transferase subunit TsaD [Clostridiales Family XIII bacterium]